MATDKSLDTSQYDGYADQMLKAIHDRDPAIREKAMQYSQEIEHAVDTIRSWADEQTRRLMGDRQLILAMAQRWGDRDDLGASSATITIPIHPKVAELMQQQAANIDRLMASGGDDGKGLTAEQRLDLNRAVERYLTAHPADTTDAVIDGVLAEYPPDHSWPVRSIRTAIGTMVYHARNRLGIAETKREEG